jgi:hypothetical protein
MVGLEIVVVKGILLAQFMAIGKSYVEILLLQNKTHIMLGCGAGVLSVEVLIAFLDNH